MFRSPGLCHVLAWLLIFVVNRARAEQPFVSYIFPAGGQRGTAVELRVGGHYLHERCPFEMLGPGVNAHGELHRAETTV
jgi:hypothetical protein